MGMMFKNGIPYAGIPDEIDAATVGGHTVEADVPADAAFTDTINSDVTAEGNPVILKELQGGVPFSEIAVKGENISGQEMTLTATGKNQLPITVTSGTGAGVAYTVDNDEITVSGTTTGVSTITISAPNMTITQDMRLSYRGNLSGMTPKATVLRNGEKTVYPTPNDTTGSKLLAGDVLQNVYIQQQNADVAVSGSAKFQLEYGTEVTDYEKYSSETYTFTPDSVDYVIPTDITQKEGINVLAIDAEGATLSVTGVRTNAAVAKLWDKAVVPYTAEPVASTANGLNPTLDNSTGAPVISMQIDGATVQTLEKYLTELTETDSGVKTNKIPCEAGDVIVLKTDTPRSVVCDEYLVADGEEIMLPGGTPDFVMREWTFKARELAVGCEITVKDASLADNITVTVNGSEYAPPSLTNEVPIYGVGESGVLSVKTTGANIFGGLPFAQALVNSGSTNVVLDTDAKTVTFSHNTNYENKESMFENFKENTQYSFMLKGTHTNGGTVNFHNNTNLVFGYTDGTREQIALTKTGSFKEVVKSNSKKSVAYFGYCWQEANDELVLDYEQCGIFEGVITADEFEPYTATQADIPLSSPLYEGDYIRYNMDGTGEESHDFIGITFDGSESWGIRTLDNGNIMHYVTVSNPAKAKYLTSTKCTHYGTSTRYYTSMKNLTCGFCVDTTSQFCIIDNDYTDNDSWKAYLAEKKPKVVYELAEPTVTPLTAKQIAEFEKLHSFDGTTHITCEAECEVQYFYDSVSGKAVAMVASKANTSAELPIGSVIMIEEQNTEKPKYGTWHYLFTQTIDGEEGGTPRAVSVKLYQRAE